MLNKINTKITLDVFTFPLPNLFCTYGCDFCYGPYLWHAIKQIFGNTKYITAKYRQIPQKKINILIKI